MKTIANRALLLCSLFGLVTAATAQLQPVTLKQLLTTALSNNQEIKVSVLDEEIVNRQIAETRARTLPTINGNSNVTDNYKRQVLILPAGLGGGNASDGPTKIVAGTKYSATLGVEVSQPLLDMAAFTGLKATKAGREYYQVSTRKTQEEIIYRVAQSYFQLLAGQEEVNLQKRTIEILKQLVQASEGQYKNGLARKIDLDRIRVNLINAQSRLTQAEQNVISRTNTLKVTLGLPSSAELRLDTLAMENLALLVEREDLSEGYVPEKQTDIQLLESQIRLQTLERDAIRAENYPRLNAFFNYNHNIMSDDLSSVFTSKDPAITYGMGSWGIRLQVPIFDGLARYSRAAQSDIKIKQLQQQRESTMLNSDVSFENARIQMTSTLSTITAQKENVQLSGEVYESTRVNYNLGLSSLTDLLDAQTSFLEARNIYTRNLLDYKLAELEIIQSNGTLQKLLE